MAVLVLVILPIRPPCVSICVSIEVRKIRWLGLTLIYGAAEKNRTSDPTLTKEVLMAENITLLYFSVTLFPIVFQ